MHHLPPALIILCAVLFLLTLLLAYFGFYPIRRRFPDPQLPDWDTKKMAYFGTLDIPEEAWIYLLEEAPEDSICWVRDQSYYYQTDLQVFKPSAYDWFEKTGKDGHCALFYLQFKLWLTEENREHLMRLIPTHSLMDACIYDADKVWFHLHFDELKGIYHLYFAPELGDGMMGIFMNRFGDGQFRL